MMRIPMTTMLLLSGVLCTGLLAACTGAQQSSGPPTASEGTLTEAERSKIDRDLLRLENEEVQVTDVPSTQRPDGTRAYAVRIRTSDLAALRDAGISADTTADGEVRTRLSLAEIRGVAQLDAVTAIRADNDPVPRKVPKRP